MSLSDKSTSVVIITLALTLTFNNTAKPPVSDCFQLCACETSETLQFLGMWSLAGADISDRKSLDELEKKLLDGLNLINTSHFTGSQKLWFFRHLLVPHVEWPILIYEVPISLAFNLEQKASVYIWKWLKLHKSITKVCCFTHQPPLVHYL